MAENTALILHPLDSKVGKRMGRELFYIILRRLIALDTRKAMDHFGIAGITLIQVGPIII